MDDSRLRILVPDGVCGGQPARLLPPADVDIGVVYTHERQFMPRLVSSLAVSGEGLHLRLILVDNASSDGAEQWRRHFPDTAVVRNPRRLHYAANLNRVLTVATSPYVLLLNTDMYFDPEEQCVAKMVRFMDSHPDCGIAGCRLHRGDGSHAPSARRFQTLPVIVARRLGPRRLFRRTLDRYFCAEHGAGESWACDWISGCFLMIRRRALEEVGFLDAKFIKYFEDVDICLRMGLAGWRVMYHGATFCYHLEQRASARIFSVDACLHLRSYLRWIRKWGFAPHNLAAPPAARRRAG
jgi:N-acetylglucosaminyl-diphospho-decaprenol L-rhamnosyltransferase